MEMLVWIGALVTVLGFVGIVASIVMVSRARKQGLDDAALRARLSKVLPINMGSLLLSFIGIAMVVVGVILA